MALERAAAGEKEAQVMTTFSESVVENAALAWLEAPGYAVLHRPAIAAGEPAAARSESTYRDVLLEGWLRQALARLNPDLPHEALEDVYRKRTRVDAHSFLQRNRAVHRMLADGVTVKYRRTDGSSPRFTSSRPRPRSSMPPSPPS